MSYPVWPATLPRPERRTWQATPQDARLERRSDAGPTGFRRRFSSASTLVSLSVLLDRNGKAVFDNFYKETTSRGAKLFWMPDPTTDGWAMLDSEGRPMLVAGGPDDGKPVLLAALWLVTFGKDLPAETVEGVEFRKSLSVVVMP